MGVLHTAVEYAEPLLRLRASPELVLPLGRRGGTTLEKPPVLLPPGHVTHVPGVGQLFYRDTGRRGATHGTLLLLHGWMVPTDPHWFRTFDVLARRGWRVIALDARGHGRGPRSFRHFRLVDCAADAAALIRHLRADPVTVVGYSMGGMVAQLLARDHPELVDGLVLCATGCEFRSSPFMRAVWASMSALQLGWRLAPHRMWAALGRLVVRSDPETADWLAGELSRGAAWDIAEAGREIGRFDSRAWVGRLDLPAVVLVTLADLLVPPARQRELARRLGAPTVDVNSDHLAPGTTPKRFHAALGQALDRLARRRGEVAALAG